MVRQRKGKAKTPTKFWVVVNADGDTQYPQCRGAKHPFSALTEAQAFAEKDCADHGRARYIMEVVGGFTPPLPVAIPLCF